MEDEDRKEPYETPTITYEGELEVRCGTPQPKPLDWPKEVPFPE